MRKVIALLLTMLLLFPPAWARAEGELDLSPSPTPEPVQPEALAPMSAQPVEANCAAVMLVEQDSGQVIFEMNPDAPRPVASVTGLFSRSTGDGFKRRAAEGFRRLCAYRGRITLSR